jgi:endo-1,4-beta-xylanase
LIQATKVGTVECDGSTYTVAYYIRYGWFTPIYYQYYSVREDKRAEGVVHVGCHFDAWRQAGLKLGDKLGFQIVATEGYLSSGTSEVTVSEAI